MGKQILKMQYHPAKKAVKFQRYCDGKEIELECDRLQQYMNQTGRFVLQKKGRDLFESIEEAFDGYDAVDIEVSMTKLDYEDFEQMIEFYQPDFKFKFNSKKIMELPDMEETIDAVLKHAEDSIDELEKHRQQLSGMKMDFPQIAGSIDNSVRRLKGYIADIKEKMAAMSNNSVNLCFTGVYSAGKSTLINALMGYEILPYSVDSTTAKMFVISSPKQNDDVEISFELLDCDINHVILRWGSTGFDIVEGTTGNKYVEELQQLADGLKSQGKTKHEQIYALLEKLNTMDVVSSEVYVKFPVALDSSNVQFTIYDTPGTDSNYEQHKDVLVRALREQENSILIFVATPNKLEGTGNRILLECLRKMEQNCGKTSIDLGRSLFVINCADTANQKDRAGLQNKTIGEKDGSTHIDLENERLFFTSAKYGYAAKAIEKGTKTEGYEFKQYAIPLCEEENPYGFCYREDRCATSEFATKQLVRDSDEKFKMAREKNNQAQMVYVASGMYALEKEIRQYGKKYASATKAFAIIDCVDKVLNGAFNYTNRFKDHSQGSIEDKQNEIENKRKEILKAITDAKNSMPSKEDVLKDEKVCKKLKLDMNSLKELSEKAKNYVSSCAESRAFWKHGGNIAYNEDNVELISAGINAMFKNHMEKFSDERRNILETYRDKFMQEIRDAISKVSGINESAKKDICDIKAISVKPVKLDGFKKMYADCRDEDTFLWFDCEWLKEDVLEKNIEDTVYDLGRKMKKSYEEDCKIAYETMINDVEASFRRRIDEYSEDLVSMKNDRDALQKLVRTIQDVGNSLKESQSKLDEIIWKAKEA